MYPKCFMPIISFNHHINCVVTILLILILPVKKQRHREESNLSIVMVNEAEPGLEPRHFGFREPALLNSDVVCPAPGKQVSVSPTHCY